MNSVSPETAPDVRPIAVIVDREGLGDALLKLPLLRAIRRGFPGPPIWWISAHATSMAGELAPFVAHLIDRVIEHTHITERALDAVPVLRQFPPFEIVFDTRSRIASVLLARFVLKHRGFYASLPGYVFSDRRPPNRWTRPPGIGARALSLAEAALGGSVDWEGTFDVQPVARRIAAERLPDGPRYIGLAVGSREARKNWPLDRFIALARAVSDEGNVPVFLIGPQEQAIVGEVRASMPDALLPEAEPVDPALGLARLELAIALGQRLAAAVANDSGIGHLLGAIGTPLVSLFGPTDARRWAPLTRRGLALCAQDFGGNTMDAIPVDAVMEAIRSVLARR